MTVHKRSYRPYKGPLASAQSRFSVIARREIQTILKRAWVRRLLLVSLVPLIYCLLFLYAKIVMEKMHLNIWSGEIFTMLYQGQSFFFALMMVAAGSNLIAKDINSGALHLYFSRPVRRIQYLLGKLASVGLLLLLVTAIPGIILSVGQLVLAEEADFGLFVRSLGGVLLFTGLLSGVGALTMTCLSSFGLRARYVGLGWIGLYFFSALAAAVLNEALHYEAEWPLLISMPALIERSAQFFLETGDYPSSPVFVLLGVGVTALIIVTRRMRMLEHREA